MAAITIHLCNPWDSYVAQLEAENERDRRIYELEEDQARELELDPDEMISVELVEVELLPEVQRPEVIDD